MHQLRTRYGCTLVCASPPEFAARPSRDSSRDPSRAVGRARRGDGRDRRRGVLGRGRRGGRRPRGYARGASLGCRVTDSSPPTWPWRIRRESRALSERQRDSAAQVRQIERGADRLRRRSCRAGSTGRWYCVDRPSIGRHTSPTRSGRRSKPKQRISPMNGSGMWPPGHPGADRLSPVCLPHGSAGPLTFSCVLRRGVRPGAGAPSCARWMYVDWSSVESGVSRPRRVLARRGQWLPSAWSSLSPPSRTGRRRSATARPSRIPATGSPNQIGPASPYPSSVDVSGMTGAVTKVTVAFNGLTHSARQRRRRHGGGSHRANLVVLSDAGTPTR